MNEITDFHEYVKANKNQYSKKIHTQIKIVEQLLSRKDIEYKPNGVNKFFEFCKSLKFIKGRQYGGKSIKLDQEQKWIAACVLGIKQYDKEHNIWLRYFRELRIFVGRGWGKSLFASLLAVWLTRFDKELSAECFCYASSRKQAREVFNNIQSFIKNNQMLKSQFKMTREDDYNVILHEASNSKIMYGSSRPLDGSAPSVWLVDEAHQITNFGIYETMTSGAGKRLQPLGIIFSTAGTTKNSLYGHLYSQIEDICNNKISIDKLRIFFAVFEIDALDDPNNPNVWQKANPAMKYNRPTMAYLEQEYNKAKLGESDMTNFIAKHLCRQVDEATAFYDTNIIKEALCDIDINRIKGQMAYGGTDLASYANFACNTLLVPVKHINEVDLYDFYILQQYYKAESRLELDSTADKMAYKGFINVGSKNPIANDLLFLCNGDANKPSDIAEWYRMLRDDYGILFRRIGYDPEYYPAPFVEEMRKCGFMHEEVDFTETPPRYLRGVLTKVKSKAGKLSDIIKLSKILFENKRMKIDKTNKLLVYCLSNVKIIQDNLSKVTVTKKGCRGQNDGAMSLLYALRAWECDKALFERDLGYDPTRNRYQ